MRTGIVRIIGGTTLSVLMASYMPIYAYADSYDISEGSITVSRDETAQTVTQEGNSAVQDKEDSDPVITSNAQEVSGVTLTIEASAGQEAEVTIQNLNINDLPNGDTPAILTTGEGNVKINLDGVNVVKSGNNCAGLQKENEGNLIITDNNATGSLEATGGVFGAGIGGGRNGNGTDITIEEGTVTATGGNFGAGIGGGYMGSGTDITIEGGTVTATGGSFGAGIGGGDDGSGTDITIKEGGTVTATGGFYGAGIGGGDDGSGTDITIEGGTVTATGGYAAAGIGGGVYGSGTDITIEGGTVTATGGNGGAGIGGGDNGSGTDITIEGGTVTAIGGDHGAGIGGGEWGSGTGITVKEGGTVTATGGRYGAGIGGGYDGSGTDITIKEGGTVTAAGGSFGAGIGGGYGESGTDITIEGGTVTATGGRYGAGIGGGYNGSGTGITVSNNAHVMVSGGIYDQYSGAAIGDGVQYDYDTFVTSSGEEVSPDVSLLSSDGYILYYPAGTTANQIKNGSVRPINAVPITAFPSEETTSGGGNTPNEPPVDEGNTIDYRNASIVTPNVDEADTQQDEEEITEVISPTHSSSGGSYVDNSEVDSIPTSSEEFAAFLAATNNTLEVYIKKIESLMAAGDTEGLNALVSKGITLETGNWVCFNKKTYGLIEKISNLGVPVTISFAYKGRRYSTVIPGNADIRPLDLCNEEGYCGFLNLIKHYGGGEK